jgi:beta-lactamase regulating signal transducer with metallopeptidase domain
MVEASALWRASWQGALFILAVMGLCRFFPRLPAAVRCWLWWLACLKLVATLSTAPLTVPLPVAWPAALPSASAGFQGAAQATAEPTGPMIAREPARHGGAATARAALPGDAAVPHPPAAPAADVPRSSVRKTVSEAALPALAWVALAAWLAGIGTGLVRLGRQLCAARRLPRGARPVEDATIRREAAALAAKLGLRRAPPLLIAEAAPGPLVVGLWRPAVVLPASAVETLSPAELGMALAHEMAHVWRGDLWLALVPGLAQLLFFFHPLVSPACREWATAREAACDAEALRATGAAPPAYGRFLLKLLAAGSGPAPAPALGTSTSFQTMQRRLAMLQQLSPHPRRWWRVGVTALVALGVISVLPWRVTAVDAGKRPGSALGAVKELDRRVTYTEVKIPLGELMQKVADDTDVSLTAAKEVADEPVAIVVKEMPARQLLEELAELLDYRWRKVGQAVSLPGARKRQADSLPHYEIYQDVAGKQREEAARQAVYGEVEQRFREEVARTVAAASRPLAEIQRLNAENERHQEEGKALRGAARQAYFERLRARPDAQLYGLARELASPVKRGMGLLIGRLATDQWAALRRGEMLTFSTEPQRGELPLSADLVQGFRTARPSMASGFSYGPGEIGERERRQEAEAAEKWQAATGYRVTLEMDLQHFQREATLRLAARAMPFRTGNPPEASYFRGGEGTSLGITAYSVPVREMYQPVPTAERDPRIVTDPVCGTKKRFKPEPLAPANHLGVIPYIRHRLLPDLLPKIAQTYGVAVIADAYRFTRSVGTSLPAEPVALYDLLDRLATSTHRWEKDGRVVRIRSRTWFFDRPREVPLRLVRRWKALSEKYGMLPLSECVAMANTLTDAQIETESLSRAALEADMDLGWYMLGRGAPALRLYAALSTEQRAALWRGQSIPVARLLPRQRDLFVAAVREGHPSAAGALDLSRIGSGALSLTRRAKMRTLVTHGASGRAQYESIKTPESGPDTPPTTRRVTIRDRVTRSGIMTLVFRLEYGAERPVQFSADVAL